MVRLERLRLHISKLVKMTGISPPMLGMAHPKLSRHNEERIELIEKERRLRSGKSYYSIWKLRLKV